MNQRIVCAAIKINGWIVCSPRHFDATMQETLDLAGLKNSDFPIEQGFVDQFGTFLTREKAYIIASREGQIVRRCGGDNGKLFSENLY